MPFWVRDVGPEGPELAGRVTRMVQVFWDWIRCSDASLGHHKNQAMYLRLQVLRHAAT